jgi:hypothetical protein
MIWHNGGTAAITRSSALIRKTAGGVVVLSNSANDIDDIGRHLLVSHIRSPSRTTKEHKAIQLDPKVFDAYAGEYQVAPGFSLVFTREGDKLFMQPTGQSKVEIFLNPKRLLLWCCRCPGDFRQGR